MKTFSLHIVIHRRCCSTLPYLLNISKMHEIILERNEKKKHFSCDKYDINQGTEVRIKKLVHGDVKINLSEMRQRPKNNKIPPSLSPPAKKMK